MCITTTSPSQREGGGDGPYHEKSRFFPLTLTLSPTGERACETRRKFAGRSWARRNHVRIRKSLEGVYAGGNVREGPIRCDVNDTAGVAAS